MSEYNAKNYTEQGGDITHIGGKLIMKEDFNALLAKLKTAGLMASE